MTIPEKIDYTIEIKYTKPDNTKFKSFDNHVDVKFFIYFFDTSISLHMLRSENNSKTEFFLKFQIFFIFGLVVTCGEIYAKLSLSKLL